ncbi:MAG: hypothetical protein F4X12_13055 [Acidobacteriia bacterium]|nr:hypothetical protein [Terriglobia bacterium]
MAYLAIRPKNLRALDALVRERSFGWTLPMQGQFRHTPAPSGIVWRDTRLGGDLSWAWCETTTQNWFLCGEHE